MSTCVNMCQHRWSLLIASNCYSSWSVGLCISGASGGSPEATEDTDDDFGDFEGNMSTAIPEPKSTHSPLAGLLKSFANDFLHDFPKHWLQRINYIKCWFPRFSFLPIANPPVPQRYRVTAEMIQVTFKHNNRANTVCIYIYIHTYIISYIHWIIHIDIIIY